MYSKCTHIRNNVFVSTTCYHVFCGGLSRSIFSFPCSVLSFFLLVIVSFFHLQLLLTTLVPSNSSCQILKISDMFYKIYYKRYSEWLLLYCLSFDLRLLFSSLVPSNTFFLHMILLVGITITNMDYSPYLKVLVHVVH